jgi:hypothetical protein
MGENIFFLSSEGKGKASLQDDEHINTQHKILLFFFCGFVKASRSHTNTCSTFFENRAIYELMSKNVEPEGPQMMSQYGAYEFHVG